MRSGVGGNLHLISLRVILIPVYYGPNRVSTQRPSTGKNSVSQHGKKRLPISADKKRSHRPFNHRHAPCRLCVARSDSVPNTPNVLPTLPPDTVEKRELQIINLATVPSIG